MMNWVRGIVVVLLLWSSTAWGPHWHGMPTVNRIWRDIASINAVGYPARGISGRLSSLRWERRPVWISGPQQRSSTTSLRPMIRPIMSRARARSWSSYELDLPRRRRLKEACAPIL